MQKKVERPLTTEFFVISCSKCLISDLQNVEPWLKDYLEKPRLVSTLGRKTSRGAGELGVEEMIPGLAQLSMYYSQTFLEDSDRRQPAASSSVHGNRWRQKSSFEFSYLGSFKTVKLFLQGVSFNILLQVNVNIDVSWTKSKKLECLTNHFLPLTHTNDEEKKKVKGERYTTKPRWYHITFWSLISLFLLYVVLTSLISFGILPNFNQKEFEI